MDESSPPLDSNDERIAKLNDQISRLKEQVVMLFELSLSATETLNATVYGESAESKERLHHLVSRLRPLAQSLKEES